VTEDTALILRARDGDVSAFESLYEKYKAQVYRTALGLVRDSFVAEEILQDCFLRVHANLHKLDGDRGLSPWLYRVTVNLCYTHLLRHKTYNESLDALAEVLPTSVAQMPERKLLRSELQAAVHDGIEALPVPHRTVVVLHYLQGLSVDEVAYTMQCPVGTVKSRLFYARQALRDRLSPLQAERGAQTPVAA